MGEPRGYPLHAAIDDLEGAGLLQTCHLHLDGRWRGPGRDGICGAELDFSGARLDSREIAGGELFVGLAGEHVDGRNYVGAALRAGATAALTRTWTGGGADPLLSADPGRDAAILVGPDPVAALTLLAKRWRDATRVQVAAVTGTNGKTTTKDLLAALCAAAAPTHATAGNYNNDLGLPLTLLGLRRDHDLAVVELGASRAGDIDRLAALASPQVGVITNASEAHLSSFGSLAEIVSTKGELLDHLPPDGAAVLNADSPGFADWRARAACRVISCGHEAGDHRWSWRATDGGGALTLDGRTHAVPLPGRHNGANLAAALLAAEALLGAERFDGELDVADALSHYAASPHRSRVLRRGGVTVLDDTYNANPASLLTAAVAAAQLTGDGRVIAVLGAMAELGPRSDDLHEAAGRRLHEAGVDLLLAVGGAAAPLADGFAAAGGAAERCEDQRTAARVLAELVREGDRVLFKGSRSSAMEEALEAFLKRLAPDLGDLERT